MSNKEKATLDFEKLSLARSHQSFLGRSVQLVTDLQISQSEITTLGTVAASLPDGKVKEDTLARKKK